MSDNILRLIPTDPQHVPNATVQQMAHDLLASFFPQADEVRASITKDVRFYVRTSSKRAGSSRTVLGWTLIFLGG